MPVIPAIPKLKIVPTRMYSFFNVSLNLKIDFAAIFITFQDDRNFKVDHGILKKGCFEKGICF